MYLMCFTFCRVPAFVIGVKCVFSDVFSTSFFHVFKDLWQSQSQLLFLWFRIRCIWIYVIFRPDFNGLWFCFETVGDMDALLVSLEVGWAKRHLAFEPSWFEIWSLCFELHRFYMIWCWCQSLACAQSPQNDSLCRLCSFRNQLWCRHGFRFTLKSIKRNLYILYQGMKSIIKHSVGEEVLRCWKEAGRGQSARAMRVV